MLARSLRTDTGISVYNPVHSVIQEVPFLFRNALNLHNVSSRWLCMSVPCDHQFNKMLYGRISSFYVNISLVMVAAGCNCPQFETGNTTGLRYPCKRKSGGVGGELTVVIASN
jgi:hypothetical protein